MRIILAVGITITILMSFSSNSVFAQEASSDLNVAALKRDLERVRTSFRVPGMAVIGLQDGKVVFQEGFGLRNVEKNEPFTPDTICLVASTTKSFTAGLVASLVDDGKLEWQRPVREYWKPFKMVDEFASQEMTLEDMLCHRSGLPYHENLLAHGVGRGVPRSTRSFHFKEAGSRSAVMFGSHGSMIGEVVS